MQPTNNNGIEHLSQELGKIREKVNSIKLIRCILDNHRGIYIPQDFATTSDLDEWHCEDYTASWQVLLEGPESDYYWECWDDILNNAYFVDEDGRWTLHQDDGLYMVHDDYDWGELL